MMTRNLNSQTSDRAIDEDAVLLGELRRLGERVRGDAKHRISKWAPTIERASFAPAAENLAHYLALRSQDLSHLQIELSERGLSSLGRCEARVALSCDEPNGSHFRLGGLEG